MARILIATDAWKPQINGVVRTLETTTQHLNRLGHQTLIIHPHLFKTCSLPFYPEIAISLPWPHQLAKKISAFQPQHIHIATEGPIGLVVRHFCKKHQYRFTTSYHTKFPEYLHSMLRVPVKGTFAFLKWFHSAASKMFVATQSLENDLLQAGFKPTIHRWSRGVDLNLFGQLAVANPLNFQCTDGLKRPILLYAGRVSREKNLDAFLNLKTAGSKVVVGDGPSRAELQKCYPEAVFLGFRQGAELAAIYQNADLFVFPSKTDTFGIVLIEALASGLPVAAYPVTGPIDIITDTKLGALNDDLQIAVEQANRLGDKEYCRAEAKKYTWERSTQQFLDGLVSCQP